METITLASSSQRRQDYFRLLGLPFRFIPSPIEEVLNERLELRQAVEELAIQKVNSVREFCQSQESPWIVGADTIVTLDGTIYGKPRNRDHARLMLLSLHDRTHQVITAAALFNSQKNTIDCRSVISSVSIANLNEAEIEWYLDTQEWEGAAGSYKIQGLASCFITEIQGSYSSIVGLPLREFYVMLRDNGYEFGAE